MRETRQWSPFDPKWYQQAFERYISTAEELFNTNLITEQGFVLPDADQSKSSVFRNNAVTNNSFNEEKLRQTLTDIYLNQTHKLKASNHDGTHFFQWHGTMKDMQVQKNSKICTLVIPTETFVSQTDRDVYKLSQYYRKWIKVEDMLNHWDVFKWACMLFINRRVYSEYELRMDDQETVIRFKYNPKWLDADYSVDIYKFDTCSQCRVKISRELCENQWGWKMPVSYITDQRILNSDHVMVAINKISDPEIRDNPSEAVQVLGDNLEFLRIEDGVVDLSVISDFNRVYIKSESVDWLWMSIIVPKYFHQYPIILPTDVIYRPYAPDYRQVVTIDGDVVNNVHAETDQWHKVYIDLKGGPDDGRDGWLQTIRPIVFQDAYDGEFDDPYIDLLDILGNLRKLTVQGADLVEKFRFDIMDPMTDEAYTKSLNDIDEIMTKIHDVHNGFLDKLLVEYNQYYEELYQHFKEVLGIVREEGQDSDRFKANSKSPINFWNDASPLIHIPRALVDRYNIIEVMNAVRHQQANEWEDGTAYRGKIRFQRPVDTSDFWTFEYDPKDRVWRPCVLEIEHHFPDVYLLKDPNEEVPTLDRVFKAFFFYSDTINPREIANDIQRPSASWDEDIHKYTINPMGNYHDIFMEKFYWMGIRAIYNGMLMTRTRWELVEYIMDNDSYERFNDLFMKSSEPFFQMSMATFLKSHNFQFTLDESVDKMMEAVQKEMAGHQMLTNFEMYLEKTWGPSYFDIILKVQDITDGSETEEIIHRPRNSFDYDRIIPIFRGIQEHVYGVMGDVNDILDWIIMMLEQENYSLIIDHFKSMKVESNDMIQQIETVLKLTENLDRDVYSINDLQAIIDGIVSYLDYINKLDEITRKAYEDAQLKQQYDTKLERLDASILVNAGLPAYIDALLSIIASFDMDHFMKASNDLSTYFDFRKENPDDNSLIGWINRFNDPWSEAVKAARNDLFQHTAILYGSFEPKKSYTAEEIESYVNLTDTCISDLRTLTTNVLEFYRINSIEKDQIILDRLDYTEENLLKLRAELQRYLDARAALINQLDKIKDELEKINNESPNSTEHRYFERYGTAREDLLRALSYIAGEGDRKSAYQAYNDLTELLKEWKSFADTERDVFQAIENLTQPPAWFIVELEDKRDILNTIIEYLKSVGIDLGDLPVPNYNEVYECTLADIALPGFSHKAGDIAYAAHVGSFAITEVQGKVDQAASIANYSIRRTTFTDPSKRDGSYDTMTDGDGLGLTIDVKDVITTPIINDNLLDISMKKARDITKIAFQYIDTPNPYANVNLDRVAELIPPWLADQQDMLDTFDSNLSDACKIRYKTLGALLNELINRFTTFNDHRSKINVAQYIVDLDKFIQDNHVDSESFIAAYNALLNFYGTGSSWNDLDELGALITECNAEVAVWTRRHDVHEGDMEYIINTSGIIMDAIDGYDAAHNSIYTDLRVIQALLDQDIPVQHDQWYRISVCNVAAGGVGYKVGDIVKIVQKRQTDKKGDEIDDKWDEIQEDVILLQVTGVTEGECITIVPFMNYAIPYKIQGIRETEPVVSGGTSLIVDINTHLIDAKDNTLYTKDDNERKSRFADNDMVAFRLPNIHDLPISYEVYIGGKPISDYILRHETDGSSGYPKGIDVIYISTQYLQGLENVAIDFPAEDYLVYRVRDVEVVDPGAGYHVGQEVYIDMDNVKMKLMVAELDGTPYKGIKTLKVLSGNQSKENDPTAYNRGIVEDTMNNVDDEFHISRWDQENCDRHDHFVYGDHDLKEGEYGGDPDDGWYAGVRIDNSFIPMDDERPWNGIDPVIPTLDGIIRDELRLPPGVPVRGEYQRVFDCRLHNSVTEENMDVHTRFDHGSVINQVMNARVDLEVDSYNDLPLNLEDWPEGRVGKNIIVRRDETHGGHRMLYRLRTFIANGNFVYDEPECADLSWNTITIDWMNCDWHPSIPVSEDLYPGSDYHNASSYRYIQQAIRDGRFEPIRLEQINHTTYIHDLTVDDLSLFNWSTMEWEDLHDVSKWRLDVIEDDQNKKWGFVLTCLQEGAYTYDVSLFINKTGDVLRRCVTLKRNAVANVIAGISYQVINPARHIPVNVGNAVRIRKLFPYEQKESFEVSRANNEMIFTLANYIHYRNEIHLEDIVVYNKSLRRFEDIIDFDHFEVCIWDPKAKARGFETQSKIKSVNVINAGKDFVNGEAWAYNPDYDIHVFGEVTAETSEDGHMIRFTPVYGKNLPAEGISLSMEVYQGEYAIGQIWVDFETEMVMVHGDGYIHDVRNPYAPISKRFKIIVKGDNPDPMEYDVIINKNPRMWNYFSTQNEMNPILEVAGDTVPTNRIYAVSNQGRLPLRDPDTNDPTLTVIHTEDGMSIQLNRMYRRYDHLNFYAAPFPMRSVHIQRRIPESGYIDLAGKINKPLNKKYFEFWVNGKILHDEVTIISPTKVILHGLTSLRNLEIIEVNRDPNEFFSDVFLSTGTDRSGRPYAKWDYYTYLDAALEGKLDDNYRLDEQEYLLTPVWKQVAEDHPEYRNFPPNMDVDEDILLGIHDGESLDGIEHPPMKGFIVNGPTIEGVNISGQNVTFPKFGFRPITDDELIDMMNEEWKEEIKSDPYFPPHVVSGNNIWYGAVAALYDEWGREVHRIAEAAYYVADPDLLVINNTLKSARIMKKDDLYKL